MNAPKQGVAAILMSSMLLAACSDSPSSSDFKEAANSLIKEEMSLVTMLTGQKLSDREMPVAVAVDNIRSTDGATYVADVTLENRQSKQRDTQSLSLRKIDGKWQRVK